MSNHRKKHDRYLTTKTLETNITSGTGDEKSNTTTNKFESEIRKKSNYLRSIENYFKKQMALKYNTLPNEYNLMQLDNFITGKYCRALASFKEKLMYYYIEEFLKRYYTYPETVKKLPLFYEFYKSYLKFFCSPTLSDLKLNELIENMVEKKAKAFYNENFKEEKSPQKTKTISTIIFSNKIRRDISRRSTLTDLSKTTIVNNNLTNKSSITSLGILNKLLSEISTNNKQPIANCSVNDLHQKKNNCAKKSTKNVIKDNNHKVNSLNQSGLPKTILTQKFKKLPMKKNTEQIMKPSKGTSKSNQLSISPSGQLSNNKTIKQIKKSTGNINLNNQKNEKKLVHKKITMSRNCENNLESKINYTQNTSNNNNQLQSFQIHTSNTSLHGYINTQSGVKSKTRKILKIPKTQINNNKIVNNNNLTNNLTNNFSKNITYNVNTPISTNFNLSSNTLNNLYHNNSKENKVIEKKISANEIGKVMSTSSNIQNSKFTKNVRNWKNLSPNKKEINSTGNANNNAGIVCKKISSSKFGAFKLIPPKNYLFKPKNIKKNEKRGTLTKNKNVVILPKELYNG